MKGYQQLTQAERYQIGALLKSGIGIREISRILGRWPSTISREIQRNRIRGRYTPNHARALYLRRRSGVHPPLKVRGRLRKEVRRQLLIQRTPEQISNRLRGNGILVSHEAIYQFIYRDFKNGGGIYLNLRRKRKRRRSRKVARSLRNAGFRTNQKGIKQRPKIVEKRNRLGDYERDTVRGTFGGALLLTIVDRTSRLVKIAKISGIDSVQTHMQTVKLLKRLPVRTITNDNSPEFAEHKYTEQALKTQIYFNDPYCSWQRGTNENTNGLIRQYFPKGTNLRKVTNKQIKAVERRLNHRPRKCLGFKTPLEVHRMLSQGVALRA